jgi:hypothetical protein
VDDTSPPGRPARTHARREDDGELNDAGTTLTLEADGPDMSGGGGTARYRDVIEFEDDDHRTLRSSVLGDDGEWHEFMEARYRRVE